MNAQPNDSDTTTQASSTIDAAQEHLLLLDITQQYEQQHGLSHDDATLAAQLILAKYKRREARKKRRVAKRRERPQSADHVKARKHHHAHPYRSEPVTARVWDDAVADMSVSDGDEDVAEEDAGQSRRLGYLLGEPEHESASSSSDEDTGPPPLAPLDAAPIRLPHRVSLSGTQLLGIDGTNASVTALRRRLSIRPSDHHFITNMTNGERARA